MRDSMGGTHLILASQVPFQGSAHYPVPGLGLFAPCRKCIAVRSSEAVRNHMHYHGFLIAQLSVFFEAGSAVGHSFCKAFHFLSVFLRNSLQQVLQTLINRRIVSVQIRKCRLYIFIKEGLKHLRISQFQLLYGLAVCFTHSIVIPAGIVQINLVVGRLLLYPAESVFRSEDCLRLLNHSGLACVTDFVQRCSYRLKDAFGSNLFGKRIV